MTAALAHTTRTSLIGDSHSMRQLRRLIDSVAPTRVPVVIYGETGTGKELVAAELHARSGRRGAFVPFNVCAVGDTMFEDALFGHVRGAYTGALRDAPGFFREADGGTIFLDEIGALPLALQAKLLRTVETGVFRPLGASRDVRSDFRVIAATNERLDDLVRAGRFRPDLMHRLAGAVITVPALAARRDDIPLLVEHFLERLPGRPREISAGAMARLWIESWNGNVRELRQVVETAAAFAGDEFDEPSVERALESRAAQNTALASHGDDRAVLSRLLDQFAWDVDRVAEALGVHRATIYRRMKRCGLSERADQRFRRMVAACYSTALGGREPANLARTVAE